MDAATNPAAGAVPGLKEEEDLTGVRWKDPQWLQHFPLNSLSALDYFSLSQFYDRACNNEQVKMQRLDPALMSTMEGVEYKLEPSAQDANVFVITKLRRSQPDLSRPSTVTVYYVIEGEVFQAPHATTVLANRVSQMMHLMQKSFDSLRQAAEIDPRGAYRWKSQLAHAQAQTTGNTNTSGNNTQPSNAERRAISRVLFDVFDKNRRIVEAGQRREEERLQAGAAENPVPTDAPPMTL